MTAFNHRALWLGATLAGSLAACAGSSTPKTEPARASGVIVTPSAAGETPVASGASSARGTTVSGQEIGRTPGDPIEKLLMSRSPGVWVGRTASGGIAVRIRGSSSITGNNEPLYIVDGVPFQSGNDGGLTGINPYDIASIKVLKDPADLTMYGVRGANGVIVIKTKRINQ